MSFLVIYGATVAAIVLGDHWGLLHPSGTSAWKHSPILTMENISVDLEHHGIALVLLTICLLTPVLAVWRFVLKSFVFSNLARVCTGRAKGTPIHEKFTEQAWLAFHYTCVVAIACFVLHSKSWLGFHGTELFPNKEVRINDQLDSGLRFLYAFQMAFYLLEFYTLILEKKQHGKKDFWAYLFHHMLTVFLLTGSWLFLEHRIGSIVLFLHDVGDVFLPLGKCFSYAEKQAKIKSIESIVKIVGLSFFILFVLFFAIPRLILFGSLIRMTAYELQWGAVYCDQGHCVDNPNPVFPVMLLSLLMGLWPIHVYWFYLILLTVQRVWAGQYQDVRSEGEEEGNGRIKLT